MTDHVVHPEQGVPNQHAGGPPREPLGEQERPTHDHHGHDDSPEAIRKEIRRYLMVLGALAILTLVTVGISSLKLPTWQAIALGLAVATVKGSLVAAFFMHLISERKLIYAVLLFTVFFFGMLLWGPWHHHYDAEREWPGHDVTNKQEAARPPAETSHETH